MTRECITNGVLVSIEYDFEWLYGFNTLNANELDAATSLPSDNKPKRYICVYHW